METWSKSNNVASCLLFYCLCFLYDNFYRVTLC